VWVDFPDCTQLYDHLRPSDRSQLDRAVTNSQAPDVTGGMAEKVNRMFGLVEHSPDLECLIFSGDEPGAVATAIGGAQIGTLISR
jgi:isopentenyl phosphate kinase